MAECSFCGKEVTIPYTCGYCNDSFCSDHRLPENHNCEGLEELDKESKEKGEIYRGVNENLKTEPIKIEENQRRKFTTPPLNQKRGSEGHPYRRDTSGGSGVLDFLKHFFLKDTTSKLLLAIILAFIGQLVTQAFVGQSYLEYIAPSYSTFLQRPWTLVTSIFAHGSFGHMLINGIVLFFIGPALERRIGGSKFLMLFLGAGVISTLGQVLITQPAGVVLGASGAIFGILGTLTILSPKMPIFLFFIVPLPLWTFTLGYGLLEAILAFTGSGSGIAHLAHFIGILVGAGYGLIARRNMKSRSSDSFGSMMEMLDY